MPAKAFLRKSFRCFQDMNWIPQGGGRRLGERSRFFGRRIFRCGRQGGAYRGDWLYFFKERYHG